MNKFTATFSNGQTVTRTSHHDYVTATALISKETGKIATVTFSAKEKPAVDWTGLIYPVHRYGTSSNQRDAIRAKNEQEKAKYVVEIVKVSP